MFTLPFFIRRHFIWTALGQFYVYKFVLIHIFVQSPSKKQTALPTG